MDEPKSGMHLEPWLHSQLHPFIPRCTIQAEEQQYVLWGPSHMLYPQQDQLIENCLYYGNAQGHP